MKAERSLMVIRVGERCPWGVRCKHGLAAGCRGVHSREETDHFARKQAIQSEEARASCAFCVRGCCHFGERCRRGMNEDSEYDGSDDGERHASTGDVRESTVPDEMVCKVSPAAALQEGERWAAALKVEGAQRRKLSEVAEVEVQEGGLQWGDRGPFDTVPGDPNPDPTTLLPGVPYTGGYYVPLRALGSKTHEESRVERQQTLDRDRAVERLARQKYWDMREYCDQHRDSGAAVPVEQVTVRRKGRRKRARKRWKRCAVGIGRHRKQAQKTEEGARRVLVQWGFTVWSWWLLWAQVIAQEVKEYVKTDLFLDDAIGRMTDQGLPVVTPEDAGYGRKGRKGSTPKQRWLVSTEELDRIRAKVEGWMPFRRWLKAQWTERVRDLLEAAFKKTERWKEHKTLKKEVNKMLRKEEQVWHEVWAAVRAAPELSAFNRSAEVVQGVLRGAVVRKKNKLVAKMHVGQWLSQRLGIAVELHKQKL